MRGRDIFIWRFDNMDTNLIQIISNLGFPIVVSLILLLRIEHKLEDLTKAIQDLSQAIISLKS